MDARCELATAALRGLLLSLVVYLATGALQPHGAQEANFSGSGDSGMGSATGDAIPLNFMFMLSNSDSFNSWGSIPAVDIALGMVNDRPGFLAPYKLQYSKALDSQVCGRIACIVQCSCLLRV